LRRHCRIKVWELKGEETVLEKKRNLRRISGGRSFHCREDEVFRFVKREDFWLSKRCILPKKGEKLTDIWGLHRDRIKDERDYSLPFKKSGRRTSGMGMGR